jgi:hypothetical protein
MIFDELTKENCVFFLILSILSFASFLILLFFAFTKKPTWKLVSLSISPLVMYYMYLLLYSMCVRSL